jgi:uncharacterized membrane protein YccC
MKLKRAAHQLLALLEARDPGLVSFTQATKTVLVLLLTLAVIFELPTEVRLLSLICTAFGMQCRSGRSRKEQAIVMTCCGLAIVGLVTLGSALSPFTGWPQALVIGVAFLVFFSQRFLPGNANYTVFIFICYLLAIVLPDGATQLKERGLGVGAGVLISLAVTFLLKPSGATEHAWYRVIKKYLARSRRFYALLEMGPPATGKLRWIQRMDDRYDRLLVLLSYSQNLITQLPNSRRKELEPLLLSQFDILHSLYMMRQLHSRRLKGFTPEQESSAMLPLWLRLNFHEARWKELMEFLTSVIEGRAS